MALHLPVSFVDQVYRNSLFHLMLVTASIFTRAWLYAPFFPSPGVLDPRFELGVFEPSLLFEPFLTCRGRNTARICFSGVQDQNLRFEPEWIIRTLQSNHPPLYSRAPPPYHLALLQCHPVPQHTASRSIINKYRQQNRLLLPPPPRPRPVPSG